MGKVGLDVSRWTTAENPGSCFLCSSLIILSKHYRLSVFSQWQMKPTSGFHDLARFLGIEHFLQREVYRSILAKSQVAGDQLQEAEARRRAAVSRAQQFLFGAIGFLLCGLAVAQLLADSVASAWRPRLFLEIATTIASIGCFITSATIFVREAMCSDISELKASSRDFREQLAKIQSDYNQEVRESFVNQMDSAGLAPRVYRYNSDEYVVYCRTYSAFVSPEKNKLFLLLSRDVRDCVIETREVSRSMRSESRTESARRDAAVGALIGGFLFGGSGMTPGAIIGYAGEKLSETYSNATLTYVSLVTIYTKLDAYPSMIVNFAGDEFAAKEYYAILSMDKCKKNL